MKLKAIVHLYYSASTQNLTLTGVAIPMWLSLIRSLFWRAAEFPCQTDPKLMKNVIWSYIGVTKTEVIENRCYKFWTWRPKRNIGAVTHSITTSDSKERKWSRTSSSWSDHCDSFRLGGRVRIRKNCGPLYFYRRHASNGQVVKRDGCTWLHVDIRPVNVITLTVWQKGPQYNEYYPKVIIRYTSPHSFHI